MTRGVLIDSNVLIDLTDPEAPHHAWSSAQVAAATEERVAKINPLIYAELSGGFADERALIRLFPERILEREPLPYDAAFPAMRAFQKHRRLGGKRTSPLPDFYIGAHAEVAGHALLTRDARRFRTYFPSVRLITPADP